MSQTPIVCAYNRRERFDVNPGSPHSARRASAIQRRRVGEQSHPQRATLSALRYLRRMTPLHQVAQRQSSAALEADGRVRQRAGG